MSETSAPRDDSATAPAPGAPGAALPAPRRRRWLRRVVWTVALLLLLVGLSPLALKLSFVRSWVAARASKAVGAPVTIGDASAWWTSGIDLENVVVASPPGYDGPLATVPKIHVDLALGRLLAGDVDATVEVDGPRLALRRKADGRWNLAEFRAARPAAEAPDAPKPAGKGPALHLTVNDGVVEAHAFGEQVERISKIALRADLAADGALAATLGALAEKAGLRGEDVQFSLVAGVSPNGEAPLEAKVPEFDLARFAALAEGLTGWQGVRGTARIDAQGVMTADGGVRGRLTLVARGLEAQSGSARIALATATGKVDVTDRPDGSAAEMTLALERLDVVDGTGPDARTLQEPSVTLNVSAALGRDDTLRIATLEIAAGQALKLRGTGPLTLSAAGPAGRRFDGKAEVSADLARLSALKSFVPSLAPLRSGTLTASVEGRAQEGLDVGLGARVANLALAPGDLAPEGYSEREVTFQGRLSRAKDGALRVLLYDVKSALVRVAAPKPFEARIGTDGSASFAGPLDLTVDLDALSRAFGGALGLARGERLRGTLVAKGTATGTADEGRLDAVLAGRDLVQPPTWGPNRAAGALDGALRVTWTRTALLGEVKDLRGLGLDLGVQAASKRDATSTAFDGADLRLTADLAQVRAWFGGKLGIAPEATLAGKLLSTLRMSSTSAGIRVEGTTQVATLAYRAAPNGALLDEPALTIEHTLVLPREAGPLALEKARLRGNGYAADLSGSSFGSGPSGKVDVLLALDGESQRLAERVRAFLGPEYQDLVGSGRVTGKAHFTGSGTPLLAAGTAAGDFALGTWGAAGATLADGRLTVARAKPTGPYQLALTGTLNQGPTAVDLGVTPAGEALGWRLLGKLKGVDLSTVVANHGAGKYLGYVLPTLVPTNKDMPVLSGRLDADVDLAAADLSGDPLLGTLAGRGTIALTQGTLGESTLFQAIGGGQGLGEVGKALDKVAPEVGRELAGLQRAVAFESVFSRFEVGNRRLDVKEARLTGSTTRVDMNGTVGFDQHVDLAAQLWIGSRAGDQLRKVRPDQTIPLRITGTLDKPKVQPNLNIGDLLKGGLEQVLPTIGEGASDLARKLEEQRKRLFGK